MVYDKKFAWKYTAFRRFMILYMCPHTLLSDSCIYGVVYSEMRRFAKRCTNSKGFIYATARMIVMMEILGWVWSKILLMIEKFLRRNLRLYGIHAFGTVSLYTSILKRADELRGTDPMGWKLWE